MWKKYLFIFAVSLGLIAPAVAQDSPRIKQLKKRTTQYRQLPFKKNVKVGAKSRQALSKYVVKMFKEEMTPAKQLEFEKTLQAFGLMKRNVNIMDVLISFYSNNIGGFYDPASKQLRIIRNPSAKANANDDATIVHELTHALQDQHFGLFALQKYLKGNDDESAGFTGLVEGDATYSMFYPQMRGPQADQFLQFFRISTDLSKDFIPGNNKVPTIISDSMFFNYLEGVRFARALYREGGWKRINKAFQDLPASTEQILHPEKYLGKRDDPWKVHLPKLNKTFPVKQGWKVLYENTMGELGVLIFLREHIVYSALKRRLGPLWKAAEKNTYLRAIGRAAVKYFHPVKIQDIAAGWGGDSYRVYYNQNTKEIALVWHTYWDTRRDANEFHDAYKKILQFGAKGGAMGGGGSGGGGKISVSATYGKFGPMQAMVSQRGKSVLVVQHDGRLPNMDFLRTLYTKSQIKRYDRTKFAREFPICKSVYKIRFNLKADAGIQKKLEKTVLGHGKKAVPYLIGALEGETNKKFKAKVASLLKQITKSDHGTDHGKWKAWHKKQGGGK